jgi:hypothetical protein
MQRRNMLPPAPEEIQDQGIEIQYVSILATAQQAIAAAPTERWIGLSATLLVSVPEVLKIPDWDEVVRSYGEDIGVRAKLMRPREDVQAELTHRKSKKLPPKPVKQGLAAVQGAKLLSETDVGGGANALQQFWRAMIWLVDMLRRSCYE